MLSSRFSKLFVNNSFKCCVYANHNFASASTDKDIVERAVSVIEDEGSEIENSIREERIQRKRNKSRLHTSDRNVLFDEMPIVDPMHPIYNTERYQRKLYGRYGMASGVNPGICWPTKEDLAEIREYESIAFPHSIPEMVEEVKRKNAQQKAFIEARQADVIKKMAKLNEWKKQYRQKIAEKEAAANEAKAKKDRLVEEVRRHFGFKIDHRDERFKEMLEQKEKEEKKLEKEARKKDKEAKLIKKLQEQHGLIKSDEKKQTSNAQKNTETEVPTDKKVESQ